MDASSILSGYGLAGLVIMALVTVVIKLYQELGKVRDRYEADLRAEHAARVAELKEINDRLETQNQAYQSTVARLTDISDRMTNSVRPPSRGPG